MVGAATSATGSPPSACRSPSATSRVRHHRRRHRYLALVGPGQRVHPAAQVGGLDEEPDPITQQQHVVLGHQRVDPPGHEGAQVGQRVNPRGGHLRQAQGPHSGKVTKDLVDGLDPVVALYPVFFAMSIQWSSFAGARGFYSSTIFSTNNT